MTELEQLLSILNQEKGGLRQLLAALKQEHNALLAADIDAIEAATGVKNQALEEHSKTTNTRRLHVAKNTSDPSDESLRQWVESTGDSSELTLAFSGLVQLAQDCHESNRNNGRLIVARQTQARGALNIIRQTDSLPPTYSGQGKAAPSTGSRFLGKA
ncbi:MAG: flagellar biosynthesis/type III secretory pathway chaperone [Alcanivorax sp.]|jgi:flagellar biosynthesis/type III secretory pathway chaperone